MKTEAPHPLPSRPSKHGDVPNLLQQRLGPDVATFPKGWADAERWLSEAITSVESSYGALGERGARSLAVLRERLLPKVQRAVLSVRRRLEDELDMRSPKGLLLLDVYYLAERSVLDPAVRRDLGAPQGTIAYVEGLLTDALNVELTGQEPGDGFERKSEH